MIALRIVTLILLVAAPWGCSSLVKERVGSPTLQEIEVSRTLTGLPEIRIHPHADDLGWTLHVHQPVHIILEQQEVTRWQVERFVFWAPSILIGLVQCPGSALLYTASFGKLGNAGLHYGCRRLMMLEPLEGKQSLLETTNRSRREQTTTIPSNQATVSIEWPDQPETIVHYQPNEKGGVFIRVTHLKDHVDQTAFVGDGVIQPQVQLLVTQDRKPVYQTLLQIPRRALQKARDRRISPIPSSKLPQSLVVELTEFTGFPSPYRRSIKERLIQRLLENGLTVVVDTTLRRWIQDEQQLQYQGAVADEHRVSLGKWTPSTIQITAHADTTESSTQLVLTISSVTTGEFLGEIKTEGASGEWATVILQAEEQLLALLSRH